MMKDDHTRLVLLYLILTIHACQVYAEDDGESGSSEGGEESAQETEGEGDTTEETQAGSGSGDVDPTDAQYDSPLYDPDEGETGEARKFWNQLPADTRRQLAHQELGNLETNKQFQLYLQALILEAKNMYR